MLINSAHASSDTITIQEAVAVPRAPEQSQSTWMSMVPMVLIFLVFYFLLIRPQEKKRKDQLALIKSLKKGQKIVTAGGICGRIESINEEENIVTVEVAENVYMKFLRSAITESFEKLNENNEDLKISDKATKLKEKKSAKFQK